MLFTRSDVEEALRALVLELVDAGAHATIRIVGAAAVALQVGRDALTADIDALDTSSPGVKAAVKRIADAKSWPETWLNDAAKMYMSNYDNEGDWQLRADEEGVAVLVARPHLLLAMKLLAGRGRRDADDIDRLLDECGISTLSAAEELFDRYYPTEVIAASAQRQLEARFVGSG